jgi:hypothetical protein
MNRLLMFIGTTAGGYLGWWIGDGLGFGIMGDLFLSTIGTLIGVYAAWRVLTDYLS